MGIVAELKHGAEEIWDSAAEGWRRLSQQTAGALTRFKAGSRSSESSAFRDDRDLSVSGWALLASDVFEDDKKIVVRIEVPGMEKNDFDIEMHDDVLVVRGEKHLESESGEGRYRVLQCAYGSFSRAIRLPTSIAFDQAKATYDKGVLKIELPKTKGSVKQNRIKVN